jgi:transcriptional regulator with XRE-family HTH domain
MKKVTTKHSTDQNTLLSTRPHSPSSASQSLVSSQDCHSTCDSKTDHILCEDLHKARRSAGWSQKTLAERTGLHSQAIARLERGIGSVDNLIKVINELGVRIVGIGPGESLPEQLQKRRERLSLSRKQLSAKAGVSPSMIVRLEDGNGKITSLLKVLEILAPKAKLQAPKPPSMDPVDKQNPDSRFTPPTFMTAIYDAFGVIDVDPCAHKLSAVTASREKPAPESLIKSRALPSSRPSYSMFPRVSQERRGHGRMNPISLHGSIKPPVSIAHKQTLRLFFA